MTKESLTAALASCASITTANATVTVCLAARRAGATPTLYRLQLRADLARDFLSGATLVLQELHDDITNGNKTLEPYDPANVPDIHEVEFHTPPVGSTPEAVVRVLDTLRQLPVFEDRAAIINKLIFHVIAIQRKRKPSIYLFRKYSKRKELSRSGKIAALFTDGVFDRIRDPLFTFDDIVDCISIDGQMVVLKKDNYHSLFRFFEEAIKHASQTLAQIQATIPIDNAAQFESDCRGNALVLVRLRGIADRNYLPNLTIASLERKIKANNLPIQIIGTGKNKRLVYEAQHKWKFLRLLDDGFIKSDLTGQDYEVTGKRPL